MDSFSSGEVLVIAVVSLLALDPKSAGKWWGKFRTLQKRFFDARLDLERELRSTLQDEPVRRENSQDRLRSWGRDRVAMLGQTEADSAPEQILSKLRSWDLYATASDIAGFWPLEREIPLKSVLEGISADGKHLWFPKTAPHMGTGTQVGNGTQVGTGTHMGTGNQSGSMEMVQVANLESDLAEGRWGLREPVAEPSHPVPAKILVLVPGEIFDLHGARIGKGGGFYDRWLQRHPQAIRVAVCWDAQVHPGKLPQGGHDQQMDHLLTPARFVHFATERTAAPPEEAVETPPEDMNA